MLSSIGSSFVFSSSATARDSLDSVPLSVLNKLNWTEYREVRVSMEGCNRLLCLLFAFVLLGGCSVAQTISTHPAANPLDLAGGKVAVLIFVRTDCPVSGRYAPTIQQASAQHQKDARFYLVFPDKSDSSAAIRKYMRDFRYSIPALRDSRHALVKLAHAHVTPEAAVFNAKGGLVYHGRIDNLYESFGHARPAPTTHELEDAIQAALAGRPPSLTEAASVGCYISDLE